MIFEFKGSLHSHGCWTDYRNPNEQAKFPFNLEAFTICCLDCGRDFQAITDIMANWSGKPDFIEHRYQALLDTIAPKCRIYVEKGSRESIVYHNDRKLVIPRSQEILTNTHFKHILAVGTEKDIRGGRAVKDILKDIKDSQGYAGIDHPFMCDAWQEDEILALHEQGIVDFAEWNGGLTLPSFFSFLMEKVPTKSSNNRVLSLEENIPIIANDDSHCAQDVIDGAHTSYFINDSSNPCVDRIFDAIRRREFERHEKYSGFFSPVRHVMYGRQSQKMFKEKGLPDA